MKKNYFILFISMFCLFNFSSAQSSYVATVPAGLSMISDGNILYVVNSTTIFKIDLTASSPVSEVLFSGYTSSQAIALKGNELYVAEFNEKKISKIDISSPSPTITDVITGLSDKPTGLLFNGNDLYISFVFANKIGKIDVSLNAPSLNNIVNTTLPRGMILNANDMYFTTNSGISKFDITESTPTVTTVVSGLSGAHNLRLNGNDLYVTELNSDKVSKVNITDSSPIAVEILNNFSGPSGIAIINDVIYVCQVFGSNVIKLDNSLLIEDFSGKSNNLIVYPNPTSDYIQIEGISEKQQYKIFNILGETIQQGSIENMQRIYIDNVSKGTYIIKTKEGKESKFLKK